MSINVVYLSNVNTPFQPRDEEQEVCIANISPEERRKRLRFCIQQFVIMLLILSVLMLLRVNPLWYLLPF